MRASMADAVAEILREVYRERASNRSYSLRAFARDLGISHTYLSLVFNGKKKFPAATLRSLSDKLRLRADQLEKMADPSDRASKDRFSRLEMDKFRLMSRWYYIAILDLVDLKSFVFTPQNIASYLSVDFEEVKEALQTLKRLEVLKLENGKWSKVQSKFSIVLPTSMEAIRHYHRQMIHQASRELEKTGEHDFKLRDITGMTMPINPRRIAGAKRRIARFRRSLEAYLTQGECSEVYQLNIQLFTHRGGGHRESDGRENRW